MLLHRCVLGLEWQALDHLVPIPELLPRDAREAKKQPQLLLQQVTFSPALDLEMGEHELGFP